MTKDKFVWVVINIVAIAMSLSAVYHLYQNSKTDGFGRGSVVVESCQERNWEQKIYICKGLYYYSGGTDLIRDVTVTTIGEYKKGDIVQAYPADGNLHNIRDSREFVSDVIFKSVRYNAGWLTLLFLSLFVILGSLSYASARYFKVKCIL